MYNENLEGWSWTRLIHGGVITEGKAILHNAYLRASSGGAATGTIYDGVDTNGRNFHTLRAAANARDGMRGAADVHFEHGIYIDVGSNVEEVLVIYRPLKQNVIPKAD